MRRGCESWWSWASCAVLATLAVVSPSPAQHGIVLSGAGAVNRSMAGASAVPLDASGALYWNPATISGLGGSELSFGMELLYPRTHLSSSTPPGFAAPGFPPVAFAGSDRSDAGIFPIPTVGLVYQPEDSRATYGLGFFAAGGFAVNYPASTNNPILTAQPPRGFGFGPLTAELQVMQIVPTVSYQLTDRLSIGFAPTASMANLRLDPAFVFAPDDSNGDGFATYPAANHTRIHWGLGFQLGLYYRTDAGWHFGASVKSPQWFETFRAKATDELGRPRDLEFRFDYPLMVCVGAAYSGFERLTLASDFRYIDYHNTEAFDRTGFDAAGAVRGVGWDSIFVVALGAQYQLTDPLSVRMGYSFNTNPIGHEVTTFNIASPLMVEHTIYAGASYKVTDCFLMSVAYVHAFENSVRSPIISRLGPIPGSLVQSNVSADAVILGATIKF
jgi:long-chain fatty acid transport protein